MGAGGRLCVQPVTEGCQEEGTRLLVWAGFTYMFLPHLTRTPPTLPPCGKETDQMSPQIRREVHSQRIGHTVHVELKSQKRNNFSQGEIFRQILIQFQQLKPINVLPKSSFLLL